MKYNKDILDRFLTENVAINVETKQEWDDFMKLLESETECKWMGGKFPTYFDHWYRYQGESSIVFNFRDDNTLSFATSDFFKEEGYEVIKYKDLIKGEETMTNIEKVNKALAGADESKIKEVLDFLGYKEDGKFIPKENERYWAIDMLGVVDYYHWGDDRFDKYQLSIGNVYRTEEEAEQALDFQTRKAELIKEIEDSSDVIDWRDGRQSKYHILLDRCNNSLVVRGNVFEQTHGTAYTTNTAFLYELIETRSDEVKELLFGVK